MLQEDNALNHVSIVSFLFDQYATLHTVNRYISNSIKKVQQEQVLIINIEEW